MERLWSYLRRFSRMTKEMRPSHRIDVLTDALIYHAHKSISNIGWFCNFRYLCVYMYYLLYRHHSGKTTSACPKGRRESYTKLQQLIAASAGIIVCIEDNIHVKIIILCINVGSIAMEDVELWLKDEASNFLLHNNSMSMYILCNLSPALHALCSIETPRIGLFTKLFVNSRALIVYNTSNL